MKYKQTIQQHIKKILCTMIMGFPSGSVVKNPPTNVREVGSVPRSGRSPGGGNGNLLQYSCVENSIDRGIWWTTVQRAPKS